MADIHPLVLQLRFTRNEFKRGLKGLSEQDATKRFLPMNCISWNVGHLAWQEQRYFLYFAQGESIQPAVRVGQLWWGNRPNPPLNSVFFVAGFSPSEFLIGIDAMAVIPI